MQAHRGRSLILAGSRQPAVVHLLAHALNHSLGNVGQTVFFTDPVEHRPTERGASLKELVDDIQHGQVELLVVLGVNPVYNAPVDLNFADYLDRVPAACARGPLPGRNGPLVPLAPARGALSGGVGRAAHLRRNGVDLPASHRAPLWRPLDPRDRQLSGDFTGSAGRRDRPRRWQDYWTGEKKKPANEFSDFWKTVLHDGLIAGTALPAKTVEPKENWQSQLGANAAGAAAPAAASESLEIVFQADPTIYDGSFANNGWLQELPKPLTKLTWDNAAIMSPATAQALGVGIGEYAHGGEHGGYHMPVVNLEVGGRTVRAPVWIMPGHADRSITVHLGYGRTFAGRVGGLPQGRRFNNEVVQDSWGLVHASQSPLVGFNAYELRTSARPWFAPAVRVTKTDETYLLACTQAHQLMENRDVVRSATLAEYHAKPEFAKEPLREEEREQTKRGRLLRSTFTRPTSTTRRPRNGEW